MLHPGAKCLAQSQLFFFESRAARPERTSSSGRRRRVDQSRGIKGMARGFGGHLGGGKPSQLVVGKRQDLRCRPAVTGRGGVQEVGDLGHDNRV